MRQRFQVLGCLAAWFIATGCQWDLAQLVAWGRMFTGYSQEMSLTAAAQKTFSGEMCALCKAVRKAKQQQEDNGSKSSTPSKTGGKLLDVSPLASASGVHAPCRTMVGRVQVPAPVAGRGRTPPPIPPPRAVA